MNRLNTWCLVAGAAAALASPATFAADALKLIIPTAPGGGTDGYFRVLAKEAEPFLKEPVIVVNVPGAGGTIGVAQVVRSTPDGQTVAAVWLGPVTVSPHTMKVPYTPTDYIPVIQVSSAPYVLCVHPDFPAKNAREFLTELKNNPDKYTYGSDGVGAFVQFSTARIFQPEGIRQRIIPYSGADQTVTAFLSRTIDIYGGAIATIAPFVAEGKAKCLLLTTARRFATLPDVESLEDIKMAQAQTLLWRAVIAPRDIPQDRFDKLRDVLTRAAQSPEFKAMANKRGEEVWTISAEDAAKYASGEFVQMEQLARELHLKPN